jgi:N-hydroxyarylamine O-acetyltransferase
MSTSLNVDGYLERIGFYGSSDPTLDTLRRLHRAHVLSVPFENLDIHIPREIVLDIGRIYSKIVGERRGGFCYELNGLFAALLRELGFNVTLLSARVPRQDGSPVPEFDHLLLRVELDDLWLADVNGDSFREPIRLLDEEQEQDGQRWRIDDAGDHLALMRNREGDAWSTEYAFTLQSRELADFAGMCGYHQTSPESHFTRNRICSIATPEGRISLTGDRLIVTRGSQREETPVDNEDDWRHVLYEQFGIQLPRHTRE